MQKSLPKSSSSFLINLFGGVCSIVAVQICMHIYTKLDVFLLAIISLVAAIVPIVFCELFFLRVYRREGVGFVSKKIPDQERLSLKLLGYYGTLAFVMLLYFIIPMYSNDEFYDRSFLFLLLLLLVFVIGGGFFISELDGWFEDNEDSLWHVGNLLAGRWSVVDRQKIIKYSRSVILRAYFLPVMLAYLFYNVTMMTEGQDAFIDAYFMDFSDTSSQSFILLKFMVLLYFYLAIIDTLFAVIGYLMAFKGLDSHIRSTDPTFLGWFVCLCCYYPFWELLFLEQFFIDFFNNPSWVKWFEGLPAWAIVMWGTLVISSMGLEALTTLTFGIRFSNLTYRGLITEGPFRFTKHPQYIFKMFNRFFYFLPFLSLAGFLGAVQMMCLFFGICFLYYLRAKTEENHLSIYPEYVEYANWINENGSFRFLTKFFPFLIYSEEKAIARKLF